jgi:hypothetical protein
MEDAADAGYGLRWLAAVMIVIASWRLYRCSSRASTNGGG